MTTGSMDNTVLGLGARHAGATALFAHGQATTDALTRRQTEFSAVLGQAKSGDGAPTPEDRARQAAEDFVAIALVQPILKQMRESNQTPPPFGPGEGEKALGGLADAQVARSIVRQGQWSVVGSIEQQMLKRLRAESAAQEAQS